MTYSEVTYYADSTVRVTNQWIRLGERIYSLADVQSVKVGTAQAEPVKELPYFLIIAGSITAFILLNLQALLPQSWDEVTPHVLTLGMLIGLAGLGLLLLQMLVFTTDCVYVIRLRGTWGKATPFGSDDERYVRKVASAINTAIGARRVERVEPTPASGYPA